MLSRWDPRSPRTPVGIALAHTPLTFASLPGFHPRSGHTSAVPLLPTHFPCSPFPFRAPSLAAPSAFPHHPLLPRSDQPSPSYSDTHIAHLLRPSVPHTAACSPHLSSPTQPGHPPPPPPVISHSASRPHAPCLTPLPSTLPTPPTPNPRPPRRSEAFAVPHSFPPRPFCTHLGFHSCLTPPAGWGPRGNPRAQGAAGCGPGAGRCRRPVGPRKAELFRVLKSGRPLGRCAASPPRPARALPGMSGGAAGLRSGGEGTGGSWEPHCAAELPEIPQLGAVLGGVAPAGLEWATTGRFAAYCMAGLCPPSLGVLLACFLLLLPASHVTNNKNKGVDVQGNEIKYKEGVGGDLAPLERVRCRQLRCVPALKQVFRPGRLLSAPSPN